TGGGESREVSVRRHAAHGDSVSRRRVGSRMVAVLSRRLTTAAAFLMAAFPGSFDAAAAPPFAGANQFIQKNCALCHSSSRAKAGLDLTKLAYTPTDPDNFAKWVKVHDRVSAGEMPPAGLPRPEAVSLAQFVDGLTATLTKYERDVATERGRAGLRRLNAYEYENAIRDLLNVPWVQIKDKL